MTVKMSVFQSPKNGTFLVRLTHDFGKKKKNLDFFSRFSILVKIRPEVMFNDVLENKDFFKGVTRN